MSTSESINSRLEQLNNQLARVAIQPNINRVANPTTQPAQAVPQPPISIFDVLNNRANRITQAAAQNHTAYLNAQLAQALARKEAISVRLEEAKKAFIAADEANIDAVTKVLDFKATKPNGEGSAGLSKGAADHFRFVRRAQKATQEKCEQAIEDLEALQYAYANAGIAVSFAKRALREWKEDEAAK